MANDYGKTSLHTSDITRRFIYSEIPDFWKFARECKHRNIAILSGHVLACKYIPLLGSCQAVTFLRDPVDRVLSEYTHLIGDNKLPGDFRQFYESHEMRNRQARLLQGVPLEAFGLVGITERYSDSIHLLNDYFKLHISPRTENTADSKGTPKQEISASDVERIQKINRFDMELYREASALLSNRLHLLGRGTPFSHAHLDKPVAGQISGWAWWGDGSEEAVEVEIMVNDTLMARTFATGYRSDMLVLGSPRGGYVGFSVTLDIRQGDSIQCRIPMNDQRFPCSPYIVERSADNDATQRRSMRSSPGRKAKGYVDIVGESYCAGWAVLADAPMTPAQIHVYVNQCYAGSTEASFPRDDVADSGFHPSGKCGFYFMWPDGWAPDKADRIEVWVEGVATPLPGSKKLG